MNKNIPVDEILQEAPIKLTEIQGKLGRMGCGPCILITGVNDDFGHPHLIQLDQHEAGALGRALVEWSDAQD